MEQLELTFTKRRGGRQRIPLEKRFWMKVDKNGPVPPHVPELGACWIWTAGRDWQSYGKFWIHGRTIKAHQVSWLFTHGSKQGLFVLHRCDNPSCVRPDHLFLGTNRDNMRDKTLKGRHRPLRGERHPHAKLAERHVREIRRLCALPETNRAELARRFSVCPSLVSQIAKGKVWKHVA